MDIFESQDITKICDILSRIVGKIGIAEIDLCKALIKPIFDFVASTIEAVVDLACTPIHIPLLSDVLEIFGIKEFSIADMVTFPTSFLATTMAHTTQGKALFNETMYDSIINAESVEDVFISGHAYSLKSVQFRENVMANSNKKISAEDDLTLQELCPEENRNCVWIYKMIIFALGLGEIALDYFSKSREIKGKDANKKSNAFMAFSFLVDSLGDFFCSLLSGNLYSPMDPDGENAYVDELKHVKGAIYVYTICWKIKSNLSWAGSLIEIFSNCCCEKDSNIPQDSSCCCQRLGKISMALQGAVCTFSFFCEIAAEICAGCVEKSVGRKIYKDVDRDENVFFSDTTAYFIDDLRTILDVVWDLYARDHLTQVDKKYYYVVAREILAVGYSVGMLATAILLSKKHN